MFNPSLRKPNNLKRYCGHCKTDFYCDGSCDYKSVIEDSAFCFCPSCWKEVFRFLTNADDKCRGRCQLLLNYLKKLEEEEMSNTLGDDC